MTTVTRRIACFCETTFDAEIPDTADWSRDPEVEQLILDGSFMSVTCPACGKAIDARSSPSGSPGFHRR